MNPLAAVDVQAKCHRRLVAVAAWCGRFPAASRQALPRLLRLRDVSRARPPRRGESVLRHGSCATPPASITATGAIHLTAMPGSSENGRTTGRKDVIVVGMPRSGTSLTMGIFARQGYYVGPIKRQR